MPEKERGKDSCFRCGGTFESPENKGKKGRNYNLYSNSSKFNLQLGYLSVDICVKCVDDILDLLDVGE